MDEVRPEGGNPEAALFVSWKNSQLQISGAAEMVFPGKMLAHPEMHSKSAALKVYTKYQNTFKSSSFSFLLKTPAKAFTLPYKSLI